MENRRTLICLFKNDENKTFCIRNRNTDSFGADFKTDYETICGDEITIIESVIRLNKLYGSESFQVIDIVCAENKFNRDQKQINTMKSFEINQYQNKGYAWDDTLDEFVKPTYNDTEENRKIKQAIINYRNLATLYEERTAELNQKLCDTTNRYEKKFQDALTMYNDSVNELTYQYRVKKTELDDEYDKKSISLKMITDELARNKEENEMYMYSQYECKKKIAELEKYLSNISAGKADVIHEYEVKKAELNDLISHKNSEINELNDKLSTLKGGIAHLEQRQEEIKDNIMKYINANLSYNELLEKVDNLIQMIKVNDKYYNGVVPDFEIEHLVRMGMNRSVLIDKLHKSGLTTNI